MGRFNVTFQVELEADEGEYAYASDATDIVRRALQQAANQGFQPRTGIRMVKFSALQTQDAEQEERDRFDRSTYYDEVRRLAKDIVEDIIRGAALVDIPFGELADDASDQIHEAVDGHQYVIYTKYHRDVLNFSDNEEAWRELGDELPKDTDVDMYRAFWAMREDVNQAMRDFVSEVEEAAEDAPEGVTWEQIHRLCKHCGQPQEGHVAGGKCLFEPTVFERTKA